MTDYPMPKIDWFVPNNIAEIPRTRKEFKNGGFSSLRTSTIKLNAELTLYWYEVTEFQYQQIYNCWYALLDDRPFTISAASLPVIADLNFGYRAIYETAGSAWVWKDTPRILPKTSGLVHVEANIKSVVPVNVNDQLVVG